VGDDLELASSRHFCSHEVQVLYSTLKNGLLGDDPRLCEGTLAFLRSADYVQTLVPYFATQATMLVTDSREDRRLYIALSLLRALVVNTNLRFLDVYMVPFITVALSALLSPGVLPKAPFGQGVLQNYAADLLAEIANTVDARAYATVQPWVAAQLVAITAGPAGVTEKVGAVAGLTRLGLETAAVGVLPHIQRLLRDARAAVAKGDTKKHALGVGLNGRALKAAGFCVHADTFQMAAFGFLPVNVYAGRHYDAFIGQFGADLLPFVVDDGSLLYL